MIGRLTRAARRAIVTGRERAHGATATGQEAATGAGPAQEVAVEAVTEGGEPLRVRHDPLPEPAPAPDVLHVVAVEGIPVEYGGRTSSILAKCGHLYDVAGVRSVVLVRNHSPFLPRAVASMRRRGHLSDGVQVLSVLDALPDASAPGVPDDRAGLTGEQLLAQGWTDVGSTGSAYSWFEEGRLVARRRYAQGRLLLEDRFDDVRVRVRRDEFSEDGRLVRSTFGDDGPGKRRQHVAYRRDGRPLFAHVLRQPETGKGWATDLGATTFDEAGVPEGEHESFAPVLHRALDAVTAGRPTILSVEARILDRELTGYDRPHVARCSVLHSSHLAAPGDDVSRLRPSFARVLRSTGPDPVVFLTERQRAEAEAYLGEQARFRVIPHAAPHPEQGRAVDRDPDLVVMVGRLSDVKQTGHGVKAFARVLKKHPQARLEIYGDGELRPRLQELIERRGLSGSVRLMGFTTDPQEVFRRASLCLLTSKYEGAPMVLGEAMVNGCPVVSYDIRYGPSDMITDGVNGFLVAPGDVGAVAEATLRVLQDPGLAHQLSAGCARVAEQYGREAFVTRWVHLFRELSTQLSPSHQEAVS
ncbi:glycosyltransferase [uncultured Serinicoccus sp.]|uniref:glycosyltransferase n=1 Tax=uncultured Serinicoccus sp. TaxID=735514 RepID=UPI00261F6464|nr:glycosyltransferase [uncultured Serinicoccus sp.]